MQVKRNCEVVIVVPIYKIELSELENVSLMQLYNVLWRYPIVYVMPKRLEENFSTSSLQIVYFEDEFFVSRESYSKLCLDERLYNYFASFEYILIYQTDAFVFYDRLKDFCKMGYDYIGAPVYYGTWTDYHVGNGGLSLRRISGILKVLSMKEQIFLRMPDRRLSGWEEDNFFAFCGKCIDIDFRVPSQRVATSFSIQHEFAFGYRKIGLDRLPFGCHGWSTSNYSMWRDIIVSFGYILPRPADVKSFTTLNGRVNRIEKYLYKRLHKNRYKINKESYLYGIDVFMWGGGYEGKKHYVDLLNLNVNVCGIIDMSAPYILEEYTVLKLTPDEFFRVNNRECAKVIITSSKWMTEIKKELVDNKKIEGVDFFSWEEIELEIIHSYFKHIKKHIMRI